MIVPGTKATALILFAHGARDPEWGIPFRDIQRRVAERRPDVTVELAFLEMMRPSLADAVAGLAAAGCERVAIAPLFMAQGGHLKRDLPRLIGELRESYPAVAFDLLPATGDIDPIREAISSWLVDAVAGRTPA